MRAFILLALGISTVAGQSFISFSSNRGNYGHGYEHGAKHQPTDFSSNFQAAFETSTSQPSYKSPSQPTYQKQPPHKPAHSSYNPKKLAPTITFTKEAPKTSYQKPTPQTSYQKPTPQQTYHKPTPQTTNHKPVPLTTYYKPAPQPTYHKPTPQPSYHKSTPQPSYHKPTPQTTYHKPTPQPSYHEPSPQPTYSSYPATPHHQPTYSKPSYAQPAYGPKSHPQCEVEHIQKKVDVCVPAVEEACEDLALENDVLEEEEKCYTITRTECREEMVEAKNELCGYVYEHRSENAFIKVLDVDFDKVEKIEHTEVCEKEYGSYHEKCRQVKQLIKQNVPHVSSKTKSIKVTFPEALKKCLSRRLFFPKVVCEDKTSEKCIKLPVIRKEPITLQLCTVNPGQQKCQTKSLELPQTSCKQPPVKRIKTPVKPEHKEIVKNNYQEPVEPVTAYKADEEDVQEEKRHGKSKVEEQEETDDDRTGKTANLDDEELIEDVANKNLNKTESLIEKA